ncbi:hypothetical protein BDV33DRAFT_175150 [Aspergillus novoparasiticus]|uniref:Uncharacterized protein n=1 Tax=Aspergillus novoparasiticus TaxID=986946 RepID=A0A5N6EPI6_9EURO|nr:hypothetical protein BDV33DRAFT_175150 [Aspergillus novoparasiticus]
MGSWYSTCTSTTRFQYVRGSSLDLAQYRHRFKPYCCNTLSLSTRSFNRSGCHDFITATVAIASFFAEICMGYLDFLMTKSHQGKRERENDLCIPYLVQVQLKLVCRSTYAATTI